MFAVVSYKNNQYKLIPGEETQIDLVGDLEEKQKELVFSDVLLIADDKKVSIGTPTIPGASVRAEIIKNGRKDKVRIFKFHSKKRYSRTAGQRQSYTLIKVIEIKNEK